LQFSQTARKGLLESVQNMKLVKLFASVVALMLSAVTATAQSDYKIRSGDTLTIEILEDSSLNRAVAVLPNGQISFPYAGSLRASGKTIAEVEQAVRGALASNFASPPTVFVGVQPRQERPDTNTRSTEDTITVYFLGEVATPGRAEVERGTTLLQAIAVTGGVSRFAAIKRVQLRRTDSSGVQRVTIINYKAVADGQVLRNPIELKDGDVILVPERRLFE
jgi:polysaccharide export outer membrane protein